MTIGIDSHGNSQSSGGTTTTINITASANTTIILGCVAGQPLTPFPLPLPLLTITGTAGLTWIQVGTAGGIAFFNGRYEVLTVWIAQCLGGVASQTVTITSTTLIENFASIYASYQGVVTPYLDPNIALPIQTFNTNNVALAEGSYTTTLGPDLLFAFIGASQNDVQWINPLTPAGSTVVESVQNNGSIYWAYLGLMTVPVDTPQTALSYGSIYALSSNWLFVGSALAGNAAPAPPVPPAPTIKVSQAYRDWIFGTNRGIMGHLYQFTSATGINDYFCDLDIDITYNSILWKSGSLRFEGLRRKVAIGLAVDEQTLKVWANPTDTLFGTNFLLGVEEGLLDGAIITRQRIIWPFVTGNAAVDVQGPPVAVWTLFTGLMGAISKGGTTHVEMKVKSALHKLDVNMPRNYYQPGCLWTLFDSGCTLVKASFAINGTIAAGPTGKVIPVSGGIAASLGADGIANYAQGRLVFTSGINNGLQVLIDTNDIFNLYLAYILNAVPSTGDTITYYPGCSKSFNTCNLKFNNKANYRGFDKVPPIMLSV